MLIDKNVLNLDKPSQEELVEIVSVCGQSLSVFFLSIVIVQLFNVT